MLLLNQAPPVEGIKHRQENTKLLMHQEVYGPGTLYIAESHVSWVKDGAEQHTLSLAYPHIAIHAVSRDTTNQNQPCLCLIVDTTINLPWVGNPNISTEAESSDEEDEETACTEVKFIPTDPMSLEPMYQALNECQALHPDPEDQSDDDAWPEDDDEENFDEGEYEVSENGYHAPYEDDMEAGVDDMARVGSRTATTNHIDQEAEGEAEEAMETGQFDDADD